MDVIAVVVYEDGRRASLRADGSWEVSHDPRDKLYLDLMYGPRDYPATPAESPHERAGQARAAAKALGGYVEWHVTDDSPEGTIH